VNLAFNWLTAYTYALPLSFLFGKIGKVLSGFERENGMVQAGFELIKGCR